ncbi:Pentatricopeptide repeat [Dillenia turbinata]|uniref:Pentatricopeptide repeat n=1 Tax=Dillenia turbinata TaxID=194707 RepID=A0AAN8ZC50_9MAGN
MVTDCRKFRFTDNFERFQAINESPTCCSLPTLRCLSTSVQSESISWGCSTHAVLLRKLEVSLKDHELDEAWEAYKDFKRLYGFPERTIMTKLITGLSYSSDSKWLEKAYDLVFLLAKEKSELLQMNLLTKLCLSLSRAQLPTSASMILRLMLERGSLPSLNIISTVFLHLVKTEIGSYLASNLLVEICDCYERLALRKLNHAKLIKPDTMIFNLVLNACVRFNTSIRGQLIFEQMSRVGVVADAHSIIIMSQIHEMNGQLDEAKKLLCHVTGLEGPIFHHYCRFYDSLLSLHFKFEDIDAAAAMILDMYRCQKDLSVSNIMREPQNLCTITIGPDNLRDGMKIQIMPELLQKDSILKVESKSGLVICRNGNVVLSNKGLAKLVYGCKRTGKVSELSKLLLSIQNNLSLAEEANLCYNVINACIRLGWLEMAHDMLDDVESAGTQVDSDLYVSLFTSYCNTNMAREAKALLKQKRMSSLIKNLTGQMVSGSCFSELKCQIDGKESVMGRSILADALIREMMDAEKATPSMVFVFNSSIYFFCKAKMIEDALKIFRKMQERKICPTLQTFASMVCSYSSLEMYREITILWGDIKRYMYSKNFVVSQDLYELLLQSFLRGGYFERTMEIIDHMKEQRMHIDKWKYKTEFQKLHKNLYRNLKASEARTEAQSKRLEYVQAFRKWAGIVSEAKEATKAFSSACTEVMVMSSGEAFSSNLKSILDGIELLDNGITLSHRYFLCLFAQISTLLHIKEEFKCSLLPIEGQEMMRFYLVDLRFALPLVIKVFLILIMNSPKKSYDWFPTLNTEHAILVMPLLALALLLFTTVLLISVKLPLGLSLTIDPVQVQGGDVSVLVVVAVLASLFFPVKLFFVTYIVCIFASPWSGSVWHVLKHFVLRFLCALEAFSTIIVVPATTGEPQVLLELSETEVESNVELETFGMQQQSSSQDLYVEVQIDDHGLQS